MASLPSSTAPLPATDANGRLLAAPATTPVGEYNSYDPLWRDARKEAKKERLALMKAARNAATASVSVPSVSDAAIVSSARHGPRDRPAEVDVFELVDGGHRRGLRLYFVPPSRRAAATALFFFSFFAAVYLTAYPIASGWAS